MTVVRRGTPWSTGRPYWSDLTAAGAFTVPAAGGRFDRHYHDCDEYWLIIEGRARVLTGGKEHDVGPGDLVCTRAGDEHDILALLGGPLTGFFFEGPLIPDGRPGHLHRAPGLARGHEVPVI
ncbi:mannose-6-phosphate isomerase-like protein (cupin superfamily) [Thermocatellispora tengchongensis]|uniref:Mannose-6-phosphate isomerase-like protein (Cupin superfamily) n=1 Tax=Thermocatellispora tengchongensis TaxID=1073253 RepID=A0A840PDQ2_9ACTN|nr:cupin domain-containing protein [Thermocatellispora tengchongensis]MBB5135287.1 mannose-6-phosphate isomerase-like protein (cupin superfamily) [Thermocatellispora tengchongensis]